MKFTLFTTTTLATLITVVVAAPLDKRACDLPGCIAALGPAAATCAFALFGAGANVPVEIACILQVVANLQNPPAQCLQCPATSDGKTSINVPKRIFGNALASNANTTEDEEEEEVASTSTTPTSESAPEFDSESEEVEVASLTPADSEGDEEDDFEGAEESDSESGSGGGSFFDDIFA